VIKKLGNELASRKEPEIANLEDRELMNNVGCWVFSLLFGME
jgi:hypothetical protein